MNVFLWRHLKEHVYAVFLRTTAELVARLEAALTTGVLERIPCGTLRPAVKWTEASSNTYCKYKTPTL
jgi:hypothetical protein